MGDDAGDFRLEGSGMSRMLKFARTPNFEMPMDMDEDNEYKVTVMVRKGEFMAKADLTVTVTDVDELGRLTGDASVVYAENGTNAVGTYEITGGDGSAVSWNLEGADASQLTLTGTGMSRTLMFGSAPDFEALADADSDNTYMVTVKAEAGGEEEMVEVSITVTNDDEPGTVDLSTGTAVVGTEVTASLSDEDGDITGTTWQWASADARDGTFVDIADATSASYTPVEGDVDTYLMVTASYDDVHGGQEAESVPVVVSADDRPQVVRDYDTNKDGSISVLELLDAIDAHFDDDLDLLDLLDVIDAHFGN